MTANLRGAVKGDRLVAISGRTVGPERGANVMPFRAPLHLCQRALPANIEIAAGRHVRCVLKDGMVLSWPAHDHSKGAR